jgi:hypothetical protein
VDPRLDCFRPRLAAEQRLTFTRFLLPFQARLKLSCLPDMVCQPDNPCASNLTGSEASNAFCTVKSTAPGGYTCQCGAQTAVSLGPGPQQCVLCPSANPCAATLCPVGSYCEFTCGDPRGPVCTPSGEWAAAYPSSRCRRKDCPGALRACVLFSPSQRFGTSILQLA